MAGINIAIIYQTTEGHSADIARRIAQRALTLGASAEVIALEDAPDSLTQYDGVVLGGSIHGGRHDPDLTAYARTHATELARMPSGFFSVGVMASTPDERHQKMASGYVEEFVAETGWHPDMVALIGGTLSYTRFGFVKRGLMPAEGTGDETATIDYTDWEAVDEFAENLVRYVRSELGPPG